MTTGRRESYRSTCRRRGARCGGCRPPRTAGILALAKKKAKKKTEKKIEEVISRHFHASATKFVLRSAGNPGRHALWRKPGETVKALPGRPGRAGCGLPGAPRLPRPRRVRPVEPSCTGCAGAAGGRASAQAHRWRVLVANQVSEWPFGSPWVRKGRTTKNRRPDRRGVCNITDSRLTTAHYCAALRGIARLKILPLSKCPRTVRRSRSASRRAPLAAAPVALRAPSAAARAFSAIMKTALANASTRRRWRKPIRTICAANSSRRISREKEVWKCWPGVSTSAWAGPRRCRRRFDAPAVGRGHRRAGEVRAANLVRRYAGRWANAKIGRAARSELARGAVAAARRVAAESEYRSVVESVARVGAALKKKGIIYKGPRKRLTFFGTFL